MEVTVFALKVLVVVVGLGSLIFLIAMVAARASEKSELEVEPLHTKYKDLAFFLKSFTSSKDELKEEKKKRKAERKAEKKGGKKSLKKNSKGDDGGGPFKKVYVLDFEGDVHASQVENLREEVTALLQNATSDDEVVVKVHSPGGVVHGYGLAAAQLLRIRDRNIPLTVCVDAVAASGGYMMACVANKIIAAPFAIVGSIGVVAQVPNFNRLLKKHDVDYKEYTAGEFKRTVSVFGEITPKGEEHFLGRLVDTHTLFKSFVHKYRPQVDVVKVANGDYWFGEEAQQIGLVDVLQTSDDYLLSFEKDTPIFELTYEVKQNLSERLGGLIGKALNEVSEKILARFEGQKFL